MRALRVLFYGLLVMGAIAYMFKGKFGNSSLKGNEDITENRIELPEFRKVNMGGQLESILIQSEVYAVEISTDENLQEYIRAEVVNGTLEIEMDKPIRPTSLVVKIYCPDLREVEASGAVGFKVEGPWKGSSLKIDMSGGANLEMKELTLDDLATHVSGAAEMQLGGNVTRSEYSLSGACHVNAEKLISQEVELNVSGASSARIHADSVLKVNISGAGSVEYSGKPEISQHISGAGSIEAVK